VPTLSFLGWSEGDTVLHLNERHKEVVTDLGGDVPFDICFSGEEAIITLTLTVWNQPIYESIACRVMQNAPYTPGSGTKSKVGTLLGQQSSQLNPGVVPQTQGTRVGGAFRLLLNCRYGQTAQYPDSPPAYNFPFAYLHQVNDLPMSSGFKKVRCTFRALPAYSVQDYSYILYNYDRTGLPGPN
jgi:hypothetical protein